jgi:hypothetical protein
MVSRWNGRGIWKVRPMPLLMMRCGARPAISVPSNLIDPALGGNVPDSMLKMVLLPEPLGPIRPRISPCSTLNDTLLTAREAAETLDQTLDDRRAPQHGIGDAGERQQAGAQPW